MCVWVVCLLLELMWVIVLNDYAVIYHMLICLLYCHVTSHYIYANYAFHAVHIDVTNIMRKRSVLLSIKLWTIRRTFSQIFWPRLWNHLSFGTSFPTSVKRILALTCLKDFGSIAITKLSRIKILHKEFSKVLYK